MEVAVSGGEVREVVELREEVEDRGVEGREGVGATGSGGVAPEAAAPSEELGVVRERVVRRECRRCGAGFSQRAKGRPALYCTPACKQQAWTLRHPRADQDPPRPPPAVVRDVVERTLSPRPTAPEWIALLGTLADHIADDSTALAREHWHHERLLAALQHAATALDAAHPGGLTRLRRR